MAYKFNYDFLDKSVRIHAGLILGRWRGRRYFHRPVIYSYLGGGGGGGGGNFNNWL